MLNSTNQKIALYFFSAALLMGLNLEQCSINIVSCLKLKGGVMRRNVLFRGHPQLYEAMKWNYELSFSREDGKVLPFINASTGHSEMFEQSINQRKIKMSTAEIEKFRAMLKRDKQRRQNPAAASNAERFEGAIALYEAQRALERKAERAGAEIEKAGDVHGEATESSHVVDPPSGKKGKLVPEEKAPRAFTKFGDETPKSKNPVKVGGTQHTASSLSHAKKIDPNETVIIGGMRVKLRA